MRLELVRKLDVLRGVIAETVHAVGDGAHQIVLHSVGNRLILRIEVPQAQQMAVRDLPAVVVVDCGAVVTTATFGTGVETAGILPLPLNGVPIRSEVVDDGVGNDTDAVLVRLLGHRLDLGFRTDDLIADAGAGRLIDVIPVLGELHAMLRSLDRAHRDRLDRGIAGVGDLVHMRLDRIGRPHPCMQNRTIVHFLGQAIGLARRFERGIAQRTVIARRRRIRRVGCRCRNRAKGHAAGERRQGGDARDRFRDEPASS